MLIHGSPKYLLTDQGRNFCSKLMQIFLDQIETKHKFTTSYHPQTNAVTENWNKTLANCLSMFVDADQKNWSESLPYITFAYNTSIHSTTKYSPFYLLFGYEAKLPIDRVLGLPDYPVNVNRFAENVCEARALANTWIRETNLQ